MKDKDIDFSDIPEMTGEELPIVVQTETKTRITTFIDSDVLLWLKSGDGAYQTQLNAILRAHYQQAINQKIRQSAVHEQANTSEKQS